jgi:hypothetical protein
LFQPPVGLTFVDDNDFVHQIYAEAMPYVYDKFKWEGCSIPKGYKAYMDKSLMNESQWIHPRELAWLQAL